MPVWFLKFSYYIILLSTLILWKHAYLFIYWKFFFLFFNFTILYWFCHISTWIRHRYTCVLHPEPSSLLPPCTIPLGCPSTPAPSIHYHASNLDWRLVSYMILYMFQCHSPKSSPPPQSPKDCCIHHCPFCCLVYMEFRKMVTITLYIRQKVFLKVLFCTCSVSDAVFCLVFRVEHNNPILSWNSVLTGQTRRR